MDHAKMHTLKAPSTMMTDSPARMLPSFSLTEKDLPAIKEWKVGRKYKLEIEVEQVEVSKDEYLAGAPMTARFRIHKVGEKETMSEHEKMGRKGYY